jgi:hypothetical protein
LIGDEKQIVTNTNLSHYILGETDWWRQLSGLEVSILSDRVMYALARGRVTQSQQDTDGEDGWMKNCSV